MFWIIFFLTLATLITWYGYLKPYKYWKNMGVPQLNPWFIFGDAWPTFLRRKTLLEWLNWMYWAHPGSKYTGIYQFYFRTLVIKDPDLIKLVTIKDFEHFTDHQSLAVAEDVDPLWGKNLFALKGQKWRDMRALLSGTFTSSKMRIMYGLIADEAEKFVKHFDESNGELQEVEMKDVLSRYATNVIASTSFGIHVNSLEDRDNEFYRMGKEVTNFNSFASVLKFIGLLVCPGIFKFFKIPFISKRAGNFFIKVIDETVTFREEKGIVRPDMINLLLEFKRGQQQNEEKNEEDEGFAVADDTINWEKFAKTKQHKVHQITNQDITAQALIFFLAGYETVSSVMSYTCYELAINPDVQDKLRLEIQNVYKDTKGKPSYEVLLGMKYLDMVVTEGLRKWPVAVVADRICVKPYTLTPTTPQEPTLNFKVGDSLWIPIYSIHYDPKYYPDPEKFNPERFSEENKGNIKPYTYMPFGVGPRACIGSRFALLEIKSMLFHLLNKFEIVPVKDTRIPLKFSKSAITLLPEGGIPLGFKRLSK